MRGMIGIMIGFCLGFVAFYFPATYAACDWLWPDSNLCGLPAMILVAPIGGVLGMIVGFRLSERSKAG
jgi:hypothetical protein